MQIINLGGRAVNIYLLQLSDDWMLVDTGYEHQFAGFTKKLAKHGLEPSDIRVVFLTHAHDDHAGFLNALLETTDAPVILSPKAVSVLRRGQNSFDGGCTTRLAWIYAGHGKPFHVEDLRKNHTKATNMKRIPLKP